VKLTFYETDEVVQKPSTIDAWPVACLMLAYVEPHACVRGVIRVGGASRGVSPFAAVSRPRP
jgi:hypothetical protein